jgi:hypothetical protein
MRIPKLQSPNIKLQGNIKFQTPNGMLRDCVRRVWSLGFGASLELGVWDLVLRRRSHESNRA